MNKKEEAWNFIEKARCSDGNCIFKNPFKKDYGMHTNGGCRRLSSPDLIKRQAIRIMINNFWECVDYLEKNK